MAGRFAVAEDSGDEAPGPNLGRFGVAADGSSNDELSAPPPLAVRRRGPARSEPGADGVAWIWLISAVVPGVVGLTASGVPAPAAVVGGAVFYVYGCVLVRWLLRPGSDETAQAEHRMGSGSDRRNALAYLTYAAEEQRRFPSPVPVPAQDYRGRRGAEAM
jgi:hypothetical protein